MYLTASISRKIIRQTPRSFKEHVEQYRPSQCSAQLLFSVCCHGSRVVSTSCQSVRCQILITVEGVKNTGHTRMKVNEI